MARGLRRGRQGGGGRATPTRARRASTPGARSSWRSPGPTSTTPRCKLPYQDNLSALIHEPSFKQAAGEAVFSKARVINTLGNRAVHSHRAIPHDDALIAVRELFHVAYWLARTYGRAARPAPGLGLRRERAAEGGAGARADRRAAAAARSGPARTRREARRTAGRQDDARRGAEAPARRGGRGEAGGRGAAGHPRLLRGRDPRLLHRPAAEGGRLAARPAARPRVRGQRACPTSRARASSTTCSGATTASRWGWSKPSARGAMRASASSRPSSTPIAWSSSSASAR